MNDKLLKLLVSEVVNVLCLYSSVQSSHGNIFFPFSASLVDHVGDKHDCRTPGQDCGNNQSCFDFLLMLMSRESILRNRRWAHIKLSDPLLVLIRVVAWDIKALWADRMPIVILLTYCCKESFGTDTITLDIAKTTEVSIVFFSAPEPSKVSPFNELYPESWFEWGLAVITLYTKRLDRHFTRLNIDVVDAFSTSNHAHHRNSIVTIKVQRRADIPKAITTSNVNIVVTSCGWSVILLECSIEASGLELACNIPSFHDFF